MTDALTRLLETRDWLLADGATGTNLFNMGLSSGDAPELWNVTEQDKIRALYAGAVDAGSDLFLTNSFGGNASRLKLHQAQDRVFELNKAAAELGREVADKAGRTVIVAGSVGPTGDIMAPMGSLTHEIAVEMFHEQAEGLKADAAVRLARGALRSAAAGVSGGQSLEDAIARIASKGGTTRAGLDALEADGGAGRAAKAAVRAAVDKARELSR